MEGSSGIQCEQSWSLVFLLGRGRILWQSFEEQGSAVHTNWLQTFVPDACIYKQKLYLLFFSFVSISALFVALKVSVILLGTRYEDIVGIFRMCSGATWLCWKYLMPFRHHSSLSHLLPLPRGKITIRNCWVLCSASHTQHLSLSPVEL